MLKKQTAVEWFANKSFQYFEQYSEGKIDRIMFNKLMVKTIEVAKKMEKVQIIDAYFTGMVDERTNKYRGIELYYNENFKKD